MAQRLKFKLFTADVFTVKRRLRDYRREIGSKTEIIQREGLFGRSGKVVLTAIAMYVSNVSNASSYDVNNTIYNCNIRSLYAQLYIVDLFD